MDSKVFGQLVLQLLEGSQVPGNAIDVLYEFKKVAEALARGEKELKD